MTSKKSPKIDIRIQAAGDHIQITANGKEILNEKQKSIDGESYNINNSLLTYLIKTHINRASNVAWREYRKAGGAA